MSLFELDPYVLPGTPTGLDLLAGGGTCGTCKHLVRIRRGGDGWFFKCAKHRLGMSHSAASDVRLSWPACLRYEEEQ